MEMKKELSDSFEAIKDPGGARDQINLEPIGMVVPICLSGLSSPEI